MGLFDELGLSECEQALRRAAGVGALVDLRKGGAKQDDPSIGDGWGIERTVRSEVLNRILVAEPIPRAVLLRGARISGGLNLEASSLGCPLILEGCFFDGPVNLRQARAEAIRLSGCRLTCLEATQLDVRGDLDLARSTAAIISLRGAHVGGDLSLDGALLAGGSWPPDLALATLASFDDLPPNVARLEDIALFADGLKVGGGMSCQYGFTATGEVSLIRAEIHGELRFSQARLDNERGIALYADGLRADAGMFCEPDFAATGQVHMHGAQIEGELSFRGARLRSQGTSALSADGVTVSGDMMFQEQFAAIGEVRMLFAEIRGQLGFDTASLRNDGGYALYADGVKVDQGMYCGNGFAAWGGIHLPGAQIHGQLVFTGATLTNPDRIALDLYQAEVSTSLMLRFSAPPTGAVNLRSARVGALLDSMRSWPSSLHLRGLTYGDLEALPEAGADERLKWIERDPEGYSPQPYEQLVAFYRRVGNEQAARRVAIVKQRRRRRTLTPLGKAWSIFLGGTVGHGYRPWLAGVWLLVLWGAGSILANSAYPEHFKAARPLDQMPAFEPHLYALDVLVPIVNLHQADTWIAEGLAAQLGGLLTIVGWVLATLFIASVTGLLKRD